MNKILFYISIPWFLLAQNLQADAIITLFTRPFPLTMQEAQDLANKLARSKKIARYQLDSLVHNRSVTGIFATYAGYLQTANLNGQLIFPRKHERPFVYLIITPKIIPITMLSNMVNHWEFDPNSPVAVYTVEEKQDEETKIYYWQVTQAERPVDNIIPLESIVLIAKPTNIYVPTGITITEKTPNLVLPDIYVKRSTNVTSSTLYMLNIAQFFSEPLKLYKKEEKRYLSQTGS